MAHSFLAAAQERRLCSRQGCYLVQFQASSSRQLARLPLAVVAAYRVLVCFESQTVSLPPTMALWLLNVVEPMWPLGGSQPASTRILVELVRASSVYGMLESVVVRMDHAAQVRHVGNRDKALQP